jgi:L-lactate dehydrogenase complex protein LldG
MTTPAAGGRERVLAGIRESLGRDAPSGPITPLPGSAPRPAAALDRVAQFVAKMREKSATVEALDSLAEVGAAVQRFVAAQKADPRLRVSAALSDVAWPEGLTVSQGAAVREDQTSVTPCFAALSESGAVVTLSGADTPSSLNFIPDNHIVVVHAAQVVDHLEDVWARLRASGLAMPRTVNIISGPSRTADIEQTIQLGAHGPRRLHILLVGD